MCCLDWLLPKFCHISPLLDLHWLRVKQRIDLKKNLIFIQCCSVAPLHFSCLTSFNFRSSYNLCSALDFVVLFFKFFPVRSSKTSGDRVLLCLRLLGYGSLYHGHTIYSRTSIIWTCSSDLIFYEY